MSDNKEEIEAPQETTEVKAKPVKKTTKKKVTKAKATKTVEKKKTSKKSGEASKAKKVKKTTKKEAAAKTKKVTKGTKKIAKKSTDSKKKTTKKKVTKKEAPKKVERATPFSKYEKWVGEAIQALATEDKPYVSASRVKQYLIDYMEGAIFTMIPKMSRNALATLTEKKFLKKKKESYAFSAKGKEKLTQEKLPKHKKIERPVKAKPEPEAPVVPATTVTSYGRVSTQVVRN